MHQKNVQHAIYRMTQNELSGRETAQADPGPKQIKRWKLIAATCVGNGLEWYDVLIYSLFAVYISKAFFNTGNDLSSLLLTFGTFSVSYFIRPLGGIVLGSLSDRRGRKPVMTITIALMFVATLLMVVTPPSSEIGLAAPIIILISRFIQGFAAGGEFGSATALMIEHLPQRYGFAASWQFTSQAAASLVGSLIGTILTSILSSVQLETWGFRIPFILGLLIGPIGLYLRRALPETPAFLTLQNESTKVPSTNSSQGLDPHPLLTVIKSQKTLLLLVIGTLAFSTCLQYFISYVPTFAKSNLHLSQSSGFIAATIGSLALIIVTPLAGYFCDKIGRIKIMLPAAIAAFILSWPLFTWIMHSGSTITLVLVVLVLSCCKALYYGPMASVMGDIFPVRTRGIGLSAGYSIGVALFGGLTPTIATFLISVTNSSRAPVYWVMLVTLLSILVLVILRMRKNIH